MTRVQGATRIIAAIVMTGLLAGVAAVGFYFLADRFGEMLFAWAEANAAPMRLPYVVVVPTVGLLLVGLVLQRYPEARLGGVREVLEAIQQHAGVVPIVRIVNVILSGLVLAFGGSVGPEGPMVQMGALVGSLVGQRCGLTAATLQMMVRAGAAAGIAAAFRSPAGGVLLTLEVFGARFDRDLTAIAAAAGLGYLTRTAILGDAYPFRPAGEMHAVPLAGLLLVVPLMGLAAAPAGHLFIRMFEKLRGFLPATWPLALRVAVGGMLVGIIGIQFPQVMSAGYPVIRLSLTKGMAVDLFVVLLLLKMLATSLTFGSGAVGGLFAPTLVMGALFGGAFGYGFHHLAPWAVPDPELFVLLGMVVMFGSIVKGYWSGLLMIADLSGCYHQLLLPGIIAGGISFLLSWELHDKSVFGLTIDPASREEAPKVPAMSG
jgi:chloride channel protein, CIC family